MKNPSLLVLSLCVALSASFAKANSKTAATKASDAKPLYQAINVAKFLDLKKDTAHPLYVFDANTQETRHNEGVIPGAKILSSSKEYDLAKELPAEKTARLVF